MGLPNEFLQHDVVPMIVVGRGGPGDQYQDSSLSGRIQMKSPAIHGENVPLDHLALSGGGLPMTGGAQCTFHGVPDAGSFGLAHHETGRSDMYGGSIPFGFVNSSDAGTPGNFGLLQAFLSFASMFDGRMSPPSYYETNEGGAVIRKIREKGPYNYNMTQGIPTHTAMPQIAGIRLPALKGIPTALQAASGMLSGDMLSNLPGVIMGIGQIVAGIMANKQTRSQVTQNYSPQMINAITSIGNLSQSGDHLNAGGYVSGIRVDQDVFTQNAVNLLQDCNTVADLLNCVEELSSNTSYHGMGALDLALDLSDGAGEFLPGETVYQDIVTANTTVIASNYVTLRLGVGEGNFMIGETAYDVSANTDQPIGSTTSSPIGTVVNWLSDQNILVLYSANSTTGTVHSGSVVSDSAKYKIDSYTDTNLAPAKHALGTVRSWNSVQKILDVASPNEELFNPNWSVYSESGASYNINRFTYFNNDDYTSYEITNSYGTTQLQIDSQGNSRQSPSNDAFNAMQIVGAAMNIASVFPSIGGGNLFGGSAGQMMSMINGLSSGSMGSALSLLNAIGPGASAITAITKAFNPCLPGLAAAMGGAGALAGGLGSLGGALGGLGGALGAVGAVGSLASAVVSGNPVAAIAAAGNLARNIH